MSTKTTFKRIALVAVAALGLGVLSVAPSSATVSALTISGATNGTSTNSTEGYVSDSTTAATFSVSGLLDAAGVSDTITVAFVAKSVPAGSAAAPYMYYVDSATSGLTLVDTLTSVTAPYAAATKILPIDGGSQVSLGVSSASGQQIRIVRAAPGYVGAKLAIQLDSGTARAAGTYTYTVIVKGYSGSAAVQTLTQDVSIVVAATTTSAKQ
jgi:trimeric autotransporter adhesin